MSHASNLRDNAAEWIISECPQRAEWAIAAADRIEALEAAVDLARTEALHQQIAELHATTVEQAEHIGRLEAEIHRLHYFASVIDEHAENIKSEAAIALRPQHVDIVKDGTIAHATGHNGDRLRRIAEDHRMRLGAMADLIDHLERELERTRQASVEAAIALHPPIVVDIVKDGTIAYPSGHGPTDPPRPVQRHG